MRGIWIACDGGDLVVWPPERLTDQDRETLRSNKSELLARLRNYRGITPNSRQPLIQPAVRAKIEAIEADARAKGWPAELLWNNAFWDLPRRLAAVLGADDEISEVTQEYIAILKTRSELLKFRRNNA
jgi:hypothetical protein